MTPQYKYLLLLGGNIGNVEERFDRTLEKLATVGTVVRRSAIYLSEAWGFEAEEMFRNMAVEIDSDTEPTEMLEKIKGFESALGRASKTQNQQYESRIIDIDILFCNDIVCTTELLTIPHPLLHLRRFALAPLMEHWAHWQHPLLGVDIATLSAQCPDKGKIKIAD